MLTHGAEQVGVQKKPPYCSKKKETKMDEWKQRREKYVHERSHLWRYKTCEYPKS